MVIISKISVFILDLIKNMIKSKAGGRARFDITHAVGWSL